MLLLQEILVINGPLTPMESNQRKRKVTDIDDHLSRFYYTARNEVSSLSSKKLPVFTAVTVQWQLVHYSCPSYNYVEVQDWYQLMDVTDALPAGICRKRTLDSEVNFDYPESRQ